MDKPKRKKSFNVDYEKRTIPVSLIDADSAAEEYSKKELRTRAAYFILNGIPEFSVNEKEDGRFHLLALDEDFYAAKDSGETKLTVRVYKFSDKNAEAFSCVEKLKKEKEE